MACRCHTTSCPEPVPVTVNLTEIRITTSAGQDLPFSFQSALFSRASGTVLTDASGQYRILVLPHPVLEQGSIQVYLNSVIQRPSIDYFVSGQHIYLAEQVGVNDQILVVWLSTVPGSTSGSGAFATGTILGFASPPGPLWLAMDGVTDYPKSSYPVLWTYLSSNPALLASSTASTFRLVLVTFPFYNGTSLQTLQGYIRV